MKHFQYYDRSMFLVRNWNCCCCLKQFRASSGKEKYIHKVFNDFVYFPVAWRRFRSKLNGRFPGLRDSHRFLNRSWRNQPFLWLRILHRNCEFFQNMPPLNICGHARVDPCGFCNFYRSYNCLFFSLDSHLFFMLFFSRFVGTCRVPLFSEGLS